MPPSPTKTPAKPTPAVTNKHLRAAMLDMATKRFYYYCRFRLPQVYTPNRPHLEKLCDALQEFYESDRERMILNLPPRHGKTLTVELLTAWILGKQPKIGVMVACYNETLSSRFSKFVRGEISELPVKVEKPSFCDYFPGVAIKEGDGAMQLWSLENSHFSFLATSPGGTMTGIGAQLFIIDDLIRNAEEASNERILDEHWDWYNNTTTSRLEAGAKQIVIQTRWATKDLSGRLLEAGDWQSIVMPAQNDDGSMLCENILTQQEFERRKINTDPVIIAGNYQQEPFDRTGSLYTGFKTYHPDALPREGTRKNYTDVADEGSDFLCAIDYIAMGTQYYVVDILYSRDPQPKTAPLQALMMAKDKIKHADIEANNGGTGYGREVERLIRDKEFMGSGVWPNCRFEAFHQGGNKWARITTNATAVMNCIVMPQDWRTRWPMFYADVMGVRHGVMPKHDDGPDALTGIIEKNLAGSVISMSDKVAAELARRRMGQR